MNDAGGGVELHDEDEGVDGRKDCGFLVVVSGEAVWTVVMGMVDCDCVSQYRALSRRVYALYPRREVKGVG